tara:strand:- start:3634 stop:4764 length:1131 start_codon:yes stop_codon:yes gene_type:complete
MSKKVLLICHHASLTGAPKSLLNIGKILVSLNYKVSVIINKNGPLEKDFSSLGRCYFWNKYDLSSSSIIFKILNKIIDLNSFNRSRIFQEIRKQKITLCLNNTVANYSIVKHLKDFKVISWVHELSFMMKVAEINGHDVKKLINRSDFILTASKAVERNLVKCFNVKESKMYTIYEIIDDVFTKNTEKKLDGKFIIGGSGSLGWRKGTDLFIKTAKFLRDIGEIEDLKFVWKGGYSNDIGFLEFQTEVDNLKLNDYVNIIEYDKNMNDFYKRLDVFLMCSREDPFPLVNIEAGIFGTPIIGFADSGGTEEFLKYEAGILVPYGDYRAMAKNIIELKKNVDKRNLFRLNISKKAGDFTFSSKKNEVSLLFTKLAKNN